MRVNGSLVRAEPALPPPSMSFRRRGLRGVVGLGSEPRAEIFAHGFRVRDAATLDDLLDYKEPTSRFGLAKASLALSGFSLDRAQSLQLLMSASGGDTRESGLSTFSRLVFPQFAQLPEHRLSCLLLVPAETAFVAAW